MELKTAKEILAEVFGIRLQDVDVMIQNRFEATSPEDTGTKEDGLWPQEFRLEGSGYIKPAIFSCCGRVIPCFLKGIGGLKSLEAGSQASPPPAPKGSA